MIDDRNSMVTKTTSEEIADRPAGSRPQVRNRSDSHSAQPERFSDRRRPQFVCPAEHWWSPPP